MDLGDRRAHAAALALSLVVFGLVLADVRFDGAGTRLDRRIEDALAALPVDIRVGLGAALSFPGDVFAVVAVTGATVAWLWSERRRGDAALALAGVLVLTGAVAAVKDAVARARPLDGFDSLAFPSGHAARAVLVYGLVLGLVHAGRGGGRRRPALVLATWAVLVLATGAGRLLRGAHWATDVVGGWALGAAVLAAALLARPWFARLDRTS